MIYGATSTCGVVFAANSGIVGATECTAFARIITPSVQAGTCLVRDDGAFSTQIGGSNYVNVISWPNGSVAVQYQTILNTSSSYSVTGRYISGTGMNTRVNGSESSWGSNSGGISGTISNIGSGLCALCNQLLGENGTGYSISDVAVWKASLTSLEIKSLEQGFSPRRVRPSSLLVHVPLIRNIQDLKRGLLPTVSQGVTPTSHPRYYP